MRGNRILIPSSLQQETLEQIHSGHQGIIKCKERARQAVWWLGITSQIKEKVRKCKICSQHQREKVEPFLTRRAVLAESGTDLFVWKRST